MTRKREFRNWKTEVRMKESDGKEQIVGYAAVYDSLSEPMRVGNRTFRERVAPGAFDKCLASSPDIRGLFNHEPSLILGRTKAGTMTVRSDSDGVEYIIDPPNTSYARDLQVSLARGDVDQSSFGFYVVRDDWKDTNNGLVRVLEEVDCFDVSPVTYPAYPASSSGVRSAEEMRAMFPDGVPEEFEKRNSMCDCDCPECESGDCANCSDPECDDPNCEGSNAKKGGEKRFVSVGDKKLDISNIAHVREALLRFGKAGKDAAAWGKIIAAANGFGIPISEENAAKLYGASYRDAKAMLREFDPDNDGDDDTPLIEALADACDACSTVASTACGALWTFWDGKPEYSNPLLKAFVEQAEALKSDLDKAIAEAQRELNEPAPAPELKSRIQRYRDRFVKR